MSLPLDPGVQAPTGDPGQVAAAGAWHERLAEFLETTASRVEYTVGSMMGANWRGEAAASYGELGVLVAAHFRNGGSVARSAAQTLLRYAGQLEQFQREGVQAVQQTIHWLKELQRDQDTLTKAEHEVTLAQAAVRGAAAAAQLAAATPTPGAAVAQASHDLRSAQDRLNTAQTAERQAQRAVDDDEQQVRHWQQRARQIWQEAQNAASVASGNLEPLAVSPPPLAGAPATLPDALAADAPFLASHLQLSRGLAQQIAQRNASKNHLGDDAVSTDEQRILTALEHGKNLDSVPLSQPHHSSGGGILQDIAAVAAPVLTEIVGGGPEDPLADGAAALEEGLIEGGGDAAGAALSAGSEAQAAVSAGAEAEAAASAGSEAVPVEDVPQVLANQAAGNAARDAIAARYPGAETEVTYETPTGPRRVDILTPEGGEIESKVGYTSLTKSIASQIEKDQWLVKNGDVSSVEWEFSRSEVTGRAGPSGPLAAALDKAGIRWSVRP